MVFGAHHCPKCGQEYNNASLDSQDYTYTCKNCGEVITYHMDGVATTFDCPICARLGFDAHYTPNDVNHALKFSDKYNSQYGGL